MQDNLIYKFYNSDNELLYVGITNNIKMRLKQHKQDKYWFKEVNKVFTSDKVTRNEAHIYEVYYIANYSPKYNIDFSKGGTINLNFPVLHFKEYKNSPTFKYNIDFDFKKFLGVKIFKNDQKELIENLNLTKDNKLINNINTINKFLLLSPLPYFIDKEIETEKWLKFGKIKNENYHKNYWILRKI